MYKNKFITDATILDEIITNRICCLFDSKSYIIHKNNQLIYCVYTHVGVIMGKVVLCLSIQKQYSVVRLNAVKIYLFTVKIYIQQTTWLAVLAKTITPSTHIHYSLLRIVIILYVIPTKRVLLSVYKSSSHVPILWIYCMFFIINDETRYYYETYIIFIIIFMISMFVETWNYILDVHKCYPIDVFKSSSLRFYYWVPSIKKIIL